MSPLEIMPPKKVICPTNSGDIALAVFHTNSGDIASAVSPKNNMPHLFGGTQLRYVPQVITPQPIQGTQLRYVPQKIMTPALSGGHYLYAAGDSNPEPSD